MVRMASFSSASLFVALAAPGAAVADVPHAAARLEYAPVDLCPSESTIHDEVARRIGYDPFTPAAAGRVAVRVARGPGGKLSADVAVYDAKGVQSSTKTLTAEHNDCATLIAGVGASIGFAIDTGRWRSFLPAPAASPPPAPPPYLPAEPPSPAPAPPAPPQVAPASAPPRAFRLQLAAATVADLGAAPALASPGFALGLGLRFRRLSFAAEGRADIPIAADLSAKRGEGIQGSFFGASLTALAHWDPGAVFGLFGGGLATLGVLRATSYGVETSATGAPFYFGLGGRVGVEARVSPRIGLRLYGDVTGAVHPVQLLVTQREAWFSPPVAGALGLGVLVTLDPPSSNLKIGSEFRRPNRQ